MGTYNLSDIALSIFCVYNSVLHHLCVICTLYCGKSLSRVRLCGPMDCSPPGFSVHGDSPGKNTGVGSHAFLQGVFPTQELNPGFQHCRWILYRLSHQGNAVCASGWAASDVAPVILTLWCSHVCAILSPLMWAGPSN